MSTMTAPKAFASQADLEDKKITFEQLSAHCWAYTAEGDPNSGVIIGEQCIMVSDATATPTLARDLIARIRKISDKPIKYVLLTHYHAVRQEHVLDRLVADLADARDQVDRKAHV